MWFSSTASVTSWNEKPWTNENLLLLSLVLGNVVLLKATELWHSLLSISFRILNCFLSLPVARFLILLTEYCKYHCSFVIFSFLFITYPYPLLPCPTLITTRFCFLQKQGHWAGTWHHLLPSRYSPFYPSFLSSLEGAVESSFPPSHHPSLHFSLWVLSHSLPYLLVFCFWVFKLLSPLICLQMVLIRALQSASYYQE